MRPLALAALVRAQPEGPALPAEWLEAALLAAFGPPAPAATRSWSVGGVQGSETLVQSRPVVRDPGVRLVHDLLRAPSQCTLAAYAGDLGDGAAAQRFSVSRFQRWIGVVSEPELPGEDLGVRAALRAALRGRLPGHLTRSCVEGSDRELLFMAAIAALPPPLALGRAYVDPAELRRALAAVEAIVGPSEHQNLLISDGRTVAVLHRGGRTFALEAPLPPRLAGPSGPRSRRGALLLLHTPTDPGDLPAGAEAIDPGIFTITAREPVHIERD